MFDLYETYRELAVTFGPSGREGAVRRLLTDRLAGKFDAIDTDVMGNLIVHKAGPGKKVMLCAHMDSVGIVATFIDENGFIRFAPVGGLFHGDLVNTAVRFQNGVTGVISIEEKTPFKELTMENLYVDIGAADAEQAARMVAVGDFAVYAAAPVRQENCIIGPFLDNRIGCAALLGAMEQLSNTENDLYFVFTVQEEVGLRGAQTAANAIAPDYAIAVDVTDTGDTPEKKVKMAVEMGKGPAIKVMDRSVICNPQVRQALETAAQQLGIAAQREIMEFGGTDTGAIQKSGGGVLSGAVSIPARYIHSPCEMAAVSDAEQAARLLAHTVCRVLK